MAAPILAISAPSGIGKTTVAGLVASAFAHSVHIRSDVFLQFVVNGWVDPWLPEAAHQRGTDRLQWPPRRPLPIPNGHAPVRNP